MSDGRDRCELGRYMHFTLEFRTSIACCTRCISRSWATIGPPPSRKAASSSTISGATAISGSITVPPDAAHGQYHHHWVEFDTLVAVTAASQQRALYRTQGPQGEWDKNGIKAVYVVGDAWAPS